MNDFFAAIEFLMQSDMTTGKVGITGFCYGGGVSNAAAVAYPELGAAVPFYGRQPRAEDVPRIKAPLLLHYGELDTNVNQGWPAYEAALKATVVGHVAAATLGHMEALRDGRGRTIAVAIQVPMLMLMVSYTVLSLWILSQPIVEPRGEGPPSSCDGGPSWRSQCCPSASHSRFPQRS